MPKFLKFKIRGTFGGLFGYSAGQNDTFQKYFWSLCFKTQICRWGITSENVWLRKGCKRDHPRLDFLSPFFAYVFLEPTEKGGENPRKINPFHNAGLRGGLSSYKNILLFCSKNGTLNFGMILKENNNYAIFRNSVLNLNWKIVHY